MPVCITGMHRSGTSMVAHLLAESGLYLGRPRRLMPATEDNALGYWENKDFVHVNDTVLLARGATWDRPPVDANSMPDNWRMRRARTRARRLAAGFEGYDNWGWKDPRSSLNMPFWLDLLPDLKIVICLRHPLEVEQSLRSRRHTPDENGLTLWYQYYTALLAATHPEQRLITAYRRYFEDPIGECERLQRFAFGQADPAASPATADIIRRDLYRFAAGAECGSAPGELADLYQMLIEEAKMP